MKVIFLDFDGVLITPKSAYLRARTGLVCAPDAIDALNRLIDRSDAGIVVTSAWRLDYSAEELIELLKSWGCRGQVLGISPRGLTRAEEIQAWIEGQSESIQAFVILDDMSDMGHLTAKLIATDFEIGLTHDHARRALGLLQSP
jgi:hypothetical protein